MSSNEGSSPWRMGGLAAAGYAIVVRPRLFATRDGLDRAVSSALKIGVAGWNFIKKRMWLQRDWVRAA
jgi:hypothetical protein